MTVENRLLSLFQLREGHRRQHRVELTSFGRRVGLGDLIVRHWHQEQEDADGDEADAPAHPPGLSPRESKKQESGWNPEDKNDQ